MYILFYMRKLNKTFSSLFKNFKMFEAIKLILGNIHCLFFFWVRRLTKSKISYFQRNFMIPPPCLEMFFHASILKYLGTILMKYRFLFFGGCMFMSNMPMLQGWSFKQISSFLNGYQIHCQWVVSIRYWK